MKVFISHSSANAEKAKNVCRYIEKHGHSCFFAPRDIRTGFPYAEEIMSGIDGSDVMVLILSEQSNESPHVLREIERAVSLNLPIIVYKTEDVILTKSMEYFLMSHQWLNMEADDNYSKIIQSINQIENNKTDKKEIVSQTKSTSAIEGKKINPVTIIAYGAILVGAVALVILLIVFAMGDKGDNTSSATSSLTENISSGEMTDSSSVISKNESGNAEVSSSDNHNSQGVELGDTLIFGKYNDLPIKWRVIDVKDGKAMVISEDILTIKAYDAAESGKYNYIGEKDYWTEDIRELPVMTQHKLRGSNQWQLSNIRTWLNSDRENVQYNDQPPASTAMSEMKNGYDKEPGFLNSFTEEEKKAIIVTSNITGNITTEDKVFLLSKQELDLLYSADVSISAKPTEKAAELDKSGWYNTYSKDMGVDDHYWWLRDNDGSSGYEGYLVCNSYAENKIINYGVGLEGFGIRPAMTVDLTADIVKQNI